jgi:hypothetical protein
MKTGKTFIVIAAATLIPLGAAIAGDKEKSGSMGTSFDTLDANRDGRISQVEASAVGHALTLRRPLRLEQVADGVFSVDGTPTDCVNIAIDEVLDGPPDLVVPGINKGPHVGHDVT